MRFPRNVRPFTGQLDIAPFAAVCFLLVLFLLLHSSIAPVPGIRVELPQVDGAEVPASTPTLVVTVDKQEMMYFEHQFVPEEELRSRLAARIKAGRLPRVLIQADESVRQAAVLRIAGIARSAGVQEVVLATRPTVFPPNRGQRTQTP